VTPVRHLSFGEVYDIEPEERAAIGVIPSTRLFIVWWCRCSERKFSDRRVN
jgi:hypothetical protein